jgi:hypothetical protein
MIVIHAHDRIDRICLFDGGRFDFHEDVWVKQAGNAKQGTV